MPCAASRSELLAARDARQAEIDRHLDPGWPSIVAVSLGVPGADKTPPGSGELFAWAERQLSAALAGARALRRLDDALGPFAVWGTGEPPAAAKERCRAIEGCAPAARLVDLDVYAPDGQCLDRAALRLPPRTCLCCPAPARECIRLGRHSWFEIVCRAHALLLSFRA